MCEKNDNIYINVIILSLKIRSFYTGILRFSVWIISMRSYNYFDTLFAEDFKHNNEFLFGFCLMWHV